MRRSGSKPATTEQTFHNRQKGYYLIVISKYHYLSLAAAQFSQGDFRRTEWTIIRSVTYCFRPDTAEKRCAETQIFFRAVYQHTDADNFSLAFVDKGNNFFNGTAGCQHIINY